VLLAVLIGCLAGIDRIQSARRNVDRPLVRTISAATILATAFGVTLLLQTPVHIARLAIAAIAMLARACFLPLASGNALGTSYFGKVPERL
jgi:hypothetical protein